MAELKMFLTFRDQAAEAAAFYVSLFPNSRILATTYNGPGDPGPEGQVLTVHFELDGREFVALNGGPPFTFTEGFSIAVQCETQAEIDHYWDALTEGGQPVACGWLKDRFGLSWQVYPSCIVKMLGNADPAGHARFMQAMMGMVKMDLAALTRAYEGK